MEMLAARAQDHLLLKDKRIFQSLNLAARKKVHYAPVSSGCAHDDKARPISKGKRFTFSPPTP